MSKVSAFLGRKPASASDRISVVPVKEGDEGPDPDRFIEIGARIGEENEALRTLLSDTERRISELDGVKEAFGKITEPIAKTLRALEEEKLHNAALQNLLGDLRSGHDKLRAEFHLSE